MNLLPKPIHLQCSHFCGAFWLIWMVVCSHPFHYQIKSEFHTAGNLRWDNSLAWDMATSCSYCAWLLYWTAAAKSCWASMHRAHTLREHKSFAASWVHWAARGDAKACNSYKQSVSRASAGNRKVPSLIRSSILLMVMANFTLLPLNVKCYWSRTSITPLSASLHLPLSCLHGSFLYVCTSLEAESFQFLLL